MAAIPATQAPPSFLGTRRGKLTLTLLCAVGFIDLLDASIVNIAIPQIQTHLHFSVQSLQWIASAYLLTYGGFMLLGGRSADLLGRRRLLVAGTSLFGISSLVCGLAGSEGVLIGGRLAQGVGAAMMTPAALSILTTSFHTRGDRVKALGAWGGVGALSGAAGVIFGGVLTTEANWRWVFFVNLPVVAVILAASFRLVDAERPKAPPLRDFDTVGAVLITSGMLLLVYVLVNAPSVGWGTARTLGVLAGALALVVLFVFNEQRHSNPLVPLSLFKIKGLGLAASLITASFQLGGALGLAIFTSLAAGRTNQLLATHTQPPEALTLGFQRGLLGASIALVIAAVIALRSPNVRVVDMAPYADGPPLVVLPHVVDRL